MGRKVKKKSFFVHMILFFVVILTIFFNTSNLDDINTDLFEYDFSEVRTEYGLNENVSISPEVVFCSVEDCFNLFEESFDRAQAEIKCAFYEMDFYEMADLFIKTSNRGVYVSLVIDKDYSEEEALQEVLDSSVNVYFDSRSKFMHNKFCVIDLKYVITGSMNPTLNGFEKNDNNLMLFESELLGDNYEREFDQMTLGNFGSSKKNSVKYNDISLNEEIRVSNYFCPVNDCEGETLKILDKASEEILFASFVLTNYPIEDKLLEKVSNGVEVRGVVESRMWNSLGSRLDELNESIDVIKDKNSNTMHHKFFVIDNRYVITGSMNPTKSGAHYNDENIVIIDSENIAKEFKKEFERIYG